MSDPLSLSGQIGAAAIAATRPSASAGGIGRSRPEENREDRVEQPEPQQSAAVDSSSPYNVKLDPDTLRVITEVINPSTGEVMFYLPLGYRPSLDASQPGDGEGQAGGGGQ